MHAIMGHHNFTGEEIEVKSIPHHIAQQLQSQQSNLGRLLPEDKLLATTLMTIAHWFRTQAIFPSPSDCSWDRTGRVTAQERECIAENVSFRTGCLRRGIQIKLSCSLPHTARGSQSSLRSSSLRQRWTASCSTNLDGSSQPQPTSRHNSRRTSHVLGDKWCQTSAGKHVYRL